VLKTTVIITAYNRKEFIKNAVKSVLENSQRPTEIIVVKNFKDNDIDSFLDANDVINMYSDDITLGGKLSQGISQASGDIIFFLEDDDLFSKEKIAEVSQKFSKYKLGFYHNSQLIFYDEKTIMNTDTQDFLYYDKVNSERKVNYLFHKLKAGFNVSSIAVSRDLAVKCNSLLKNVKITADTFLFFCAIENELPIMVDLRKLTYYRILRRKSAYENLNISLFKMQYEDALYFKSIFSKEILRNLIKIIIEQREILYKILSKEVTRKEAIIYTFRMVKDLVYFPSKWNTFLLGLSVLSILSRETTRNIFIKKIYSNSIFS